MDLSKMARNKLFAGLSLKLADRREKILIVWMAVPDRAVKKFNYVHKMSRQNTNITRYLRSKNDKRKNTKLLNLLLINTDPNVGNKSRKMTTHCVSMVGTFCAAKKNVLRRHLSLAIFFYIPKKSRGLIYFDFAYLDSFLNLELLKSFFVPFYCSGLK